MSESERSRKGPLQRPLLAIDAFTWSLGGVFILLCNACLLIMLALTTATILLRPFGISAYWIWPWTMVFFVWLSFFGFFAVYVRLKDVRIDFLAVRLGPLGIALTRFLSDVAACAVTGVILWQVPIVLATSRGMVDGAIFPGGTELARQALSIPLFISSALILITALVDLAKQASGLPENVSDTVTDTMPEA